MKPMLLLFAALLYGTIRRDGNQLWVRWTNLPPEVIVQVSTNLATNWHDSFLLKRLDGTTNWGAFEYSVTNTNAAVYMRLRTP